MKNRKHQIISVQLLILLIITLAAGRELEKNKKKSIIPKNIEGELATDGQNISTNLSFDDVVGDNNLPVEGMNKDNTPSIPTLLQTIEQTSNSGGAFPTPRFIYKGIVDSESELYLENPTEFVNLIDSASTSSISPDDNGQFYVSQGYPELHRMAYTISSIRHPQIEMRFGADDAGLALDPYSGTDTVLQVPFTVWDLNGTPDDNSDDIQLYAWVTSPWTNISGSWGIREGYYSPWTMNEAHESDWIYICKFENSFDYSDLEAAWDYQVANNESPPNFDDIANNSTQLLRRITFNSLVDNPLTTINSINGLPRPAAGTIIRWNLNIGLDLYSANLLGFVDRELTYQTQAKGFPQPEINLISGPPGLYLDGDAVVHWTPVVNDTGYSYFTLRASNDRGYVEKDFEVYVLLNRWDYKTHNNNNLTFSVFNCGISGKSTGEDIGDGMVWNDQNGIYSGDLIIGLSETQASGRPYSNERNSDFYPLTDVRPAESPLPDFDQAFVSLYDDSQARNQNTGQSNPIGLQIIQNSYSKSTDPDRGFVILDYTIKNLNADPLDSIFVGEHFDFDVGGYADNIADYNPALKLAYAFESGGATNPGYYGITLLTGNVSGFTQNPALYDEFLQYQDMYTIHTPPDTAADVRPFLSSGPYTIPGYGSIRVVFAAVAGNDLVQLNANTAAAHAIDLNLGEYNVTFQVNMKVQEAEGLFQPGSGDIIVFRSTPTGWTGEDYPLTDGNGDGIYEITVPFTQTPGFLLEYKFAIVPGDASPDWWEDFPGDREYILTGAGEILEPVWFSNDDVATIPTSQDVTVRFRVYMNEAHEIYHFSKLENIQSVWLNGEFVPLGTGGWSSFNVADSSSLIRLYNDGLNGGDKYDGDEIWTAEVTFPAGTPNTMYYKYGAYADGVDTLNSGVNQLDNEAVVGNERLLIIDDTDPLFIPTVDIWKARTGGVPANVLTFQVDMSIQAAKKRFDPAKDEVQLRGYFNGWDGPQSGDQILTDLDNDSVYTITWPIEQPAGELLEYKYVIYKESGEVDWEQVETSGGNREFLLTGIPATLPVVYFSDDSINKTITFQVDMTVVMVRGQFNPEADSIIISGTVNGNPGSSPKFTDSGNNIFILSTEFDEETGSVIDYKYVIKYASGDSTVENITANRSITILDIPQILEPVYFGDDDFVTVQQVQFVPDPVANDTSRFYGKLVTMEGLVMTGPREIYLNERWGVFVTDPDNYPGDFSGMIVIQHDSTVTGTGFQNVKEGDIVSFTGYVDEFEGSTQFTLLTDPVVPVEIISSGNAIPPPRIANSNHLGSTAAGEALEGMFVKVNNAVVVNNTSPNNKADVTDSFGENFYLDDYFMWFRQNINDGIFSWPANGTDLYVTGYITDFYRIDDNDGYSLCPRFETDVVDAATVGPPQLATFLNRDPVFTTIFVETEVNPGNDLTNVYFQFNWQGNWEETLAEPTNLTGTSVITVYKTITSLPENTTFDIRAIAINGFGKDTSNIYQATTGTYPTSENQDITLNFPSHSNRDDYSTSDFLMFGLPGNPSKNLADLIDGTLGTQWIAFRDNGQPNAPFLVEYSSSTASQFSMGNGRAYWVLSMVPVSFTESAPTIPLNDWDEAEIPLQTGWNIITNPFTNDVSWEDVKESNTISGPIYGYSGTMNQPVTMLPYVGYYYFNEDGSGTLDIPYPSSTTKTNIDEQKLWQIVLSMTTEGQVEKLLTFGTATNSVTGMDQRDHRKPVAFDDQNGAYFIREEWDEEYSYFASDYRSEIKNVEAWEFHVTAKRHEPVSLYFNDIDMIPEAHDVFLVDVNRMTYRDLRINNTYHYSSPKTENSFQLLVGNSDLLLEKLAEFIPTRFALENNFPNPFNPETTIPVEIPEMRKITLTVYNVLGKKINTIYDGILEPGRHFLKWSGKNDKGTTMATGTYFYRLIVEGHGAHTGKMVLIK